MSKFKDKVKTGLFRSWIGLNSFLEKQSGKPSKFIFLMAHMRSGSSLLFHILASNSEITGWGERNTIYQTTYDVKKRLELFSRFHQRKFFKQGLYFIDQINHNKFTPDLDFIKSTNDIKFIFLIRKPANTIASIIKLKRDFYNTDMPQTEAFDYYKERLEYLQKTASFINKTENIIIITYEELINNTPVVLDKLSSYLNLKDALSPVYNIQKFTGTRGDPSPNITKGKIVKGKDIDISLIDQDLLLQAEKIYHDCHMKISNL